MKLMIRRLLSVVVWGMLAGSVLSQDKEPDYPLGPDSKPQEGVPQGEVKGPFEWKSEVFPGTVREYWVYVPAQYDGSKPACVLILQDGVRRAQGWEIPTVLDNLIHQGEVPLQIGIFISPGVVPAPHKNATARYNRSFEYDGLGPRYAEFLIDEILPEVSKTYRLSDDPNDRAIGGASSGAICAFTAAWERPDQFRRVLSTIGTYVSLRGGDVYPTLIRKCEPKPIRVFLQDGTRDLNLYGGSWWVANQAMLSALKFSGYDVHHAWGEGGHNSRHSAAIMPDAIRWLWRDYPEPIKAGVPPQRRTNVPIAGEDWKTVFEVKRPEKDHYPLKSVFAGLATNGDGEVFFSDSASGIVRRVASDGGVTKFAEGRKGLIGLAFAPDGTLRGCEENLGQLVTFNADGERELWARSIVQAMYPHDLVVLANGSAYVTDPSHHTLWHVPPGGTSPEMADIVDFSSGIVTSPDQSLLFTSDYIRRFTHSYQIQSDSSLDYPQKYDHVHVSDSNTYSGSGGMAVDTLGRRYLVTAMGIQIFDQPGRCHQILSLPPGEKWVFDICFGGEKLDTLFLTCRSKVYSRKVNATGVLMWQDPIKPPRPRL